VTQNVTNSQVSLAGVVVTFFPDAEFGLRLSTIAREVDRLLIVDNSAEAEVAARLGALASEYGAEVIFSDGNVGLASALNRGFAILAESGFDWVIAFDQDSTPEPGLATALLATAGGQLSGVPPSLSKLWRTRKPDPHGNTKPAAVVGANWRDEGRPGFPSRHLRRHPRFPLFFQRQIAPRDLDAVTCVITSGSLFQLPTWRALGGFDQGLFLDLVDTDYCLRARRAGHEVRVAAHARLLHRRGAKRAVRFLGRTWWPAFIPPLRLRYLFRNRILLLRRHGWAVPHWVVFEMFYVAKIILEILFLEDQKLAKLAACLRGTWDGLLGRTGRIG
jgi:rhamnosyltransferase